MKDKLMLFLNDEEGLTTVEYAMVGALISAALVGAFSLLGDQVADLVSSIKEAMD